MSASDNMLLVGFSTGLMCMIDLRNGWIIESWKTYDNEIMQVTIQFQNKIIKSNKKTKKFNQYLKCIILVEIYSK